MQRILHVYPAMNCAGTEMVMMNFYRGMDRTKIQFDFLTQTQGILENEIQSMGGLIHRVPFECKRSYRKKLRQFFQDHPEYSVVHTHTHAHMDVVLQEAKRANIPCRVAHSHNARQDVSLLAKIVKAVKSYPLHICTTHFFACSIEAGAWLFPFDKEKVKVIPNAIDLERFDFNIDSRNRIRDQLNISKDARVICHVGRFSHQKNHAFLLDICHEIVKIEDNIVILLVGTGPLLEEMQEKMRKLSLENHVQFLGSRGDVYDIMCGSDLFLFPSHHEGLGIVLVEAQTSGLPCIVSEGVPDGADMGCGLFTKVKGFSKELWVRQVLQTPKANRGAGTTLAALTEKGYSLVASSKEISEFYSQFREKNG